MSDYLPTIGLEIHAELKTKTKMFCGCRNDAEEKRPNVNICPVCMAHPGTLPVINRDAVHKVLLVGTALGSILADYSEFDRKNYFYPDIPKGYQISQYAYPLVRGGAINGIEVTRVHLEEDTARSQHEGAKSLVDFNRAGVPLMELVTEPVIHSAEDAGIFARELQLLLRYLGASDANMEKGEMRVEANISVSKTDSLGTKVEVKNLNSFRSVEKAIAFEVERQAKMLDKGEVVSQETRGWDEAKQSTFSQRKKESSHDYRYFPDPDLPKLRISDIRDFSDEKLTGLLPRLPWQLRNQYKEIGLKAVDAEVFVRDRVLGKFFDKATRGGELDVILLTANYIVSDVAGKREGGHISDEWFSENNALRLKKVIGLIKNGSLSSRGAKDVIDLMLKSSDDPEIIAKEHGLIQQNDTGAIEAVVKRIIVANESVVAEYRAGKTSALQFFVGQGMKETKGSANPEMLREYFKKALE